MSGETKENSGDEEATTISVEALAGATTMIGEDGTQYIIVMDETGEGGEATAIALPDGVELAGEGGRTGGKEDTVFVMPDGEGNFRLVDSEGGGSTDGETLIIQDGEGEGGVQYLVDEDGNLLIDEEGRPLRMALDQGTVASVESDEKAGETKYIILEDENGHQMVVDAATLGLTSPSPGPSVDSRTTRPSGLKEPSRIGPKEVVTKKAFDVPGGSLSIPVTEKTVKFDLPRKDDEKKQRKETELDWSKVDPKNLTFKLRFGCIHCKEKTYRDLKKLVKHRERCKKKEKLACDSCAPTAKDKLAEMGMGKRKGSTNDSSRAKPTTSKQPKKVSKAPKPRSETPTGSSSPIIGTTLSVSPPPSPSPSVGLSRISGGKSVHGSTFGTLHTKAGPQMSPRPIPVPKPPPPPPSISKATMDLKCRVCGKQYLSAEQLKMHLINVHLGSAAFTPQAMSPSPVPTAIFTEAGTILQTGHEAVQLIAGGEASTSSAVIGQWVA